MAQGLNSTKTAARPAHEAIESNASATELGKNKHQKIDDAAMQTAKRAQNRIRAEEGKNPTEKMFTK